MDQFKQRVTNYWSQRAEDFMALRIREFNSPIREYWLAEFRKYLPMERELHILDLGTGTGFFSFLLAEKGNRVTGIDLTEEMIHGARETAAVLGLSADFKVMDAEKPDLPEEGFDALVTRNLTWVLPHLKEAYQNWFRLLVPGGVLINFDGDYCHVPPAKDLPENHSHKGIAPELMQENDRITGEMAKYHKLRPLWDTELLLDAGFERITVDTGVWKRVYRNKDEFYNPVRTFCIAAYKPWSDTL